MEAGSNHEIYAYLDKLSTNELKEILHTDYECGLNDNSMILYILSLIEKREAINYDEDVAWIEFQQYYNTPEGCDKSLYPCNNGGPIKKEHKTVNTKLFLSKITVAIFTIILLFSGMIVAQASGIDVLGMLGSWTNEIFYFVNKNQSIQDTENSLAEKQKYYLDMRESLAAHDFSEGFAVSWIPDDFTTLTEEYLSDEYSSTLHFAFVGDNDRFFSFDVTFYQSISQVENMTFEKDDDWVDCYTSGERTFYILSNDDSLTATWTGSDGFNVTISGNLRKNELKRIIDSIEK